jgi:predicted RNA-binding Zn-ribbon protein involved in translation (DUF1610 family)
MFFAVWVWILLVYGSAVVSGKANNGDRVMKKKDEKGFMTPTEQSSCTHCGGIMRDYRGSVSCMMCGREEGHQCERCLTRSERYRKTA